MKREETLLAVLASHGDALRRIAHVYAGGDAEHEDLYQEILMQAWKALPSFRGDSSFSTWVYRVALNTAITWRRRSARRKHHDVAMAAGIEAVASPFASLAAQRSEREILRHFLDSLNGPNRTILLLYMEGLTHEEIASVRRSLNGTWSVRHELRGLAARVA